MRDEEFELRKKTEGRGEYYLKKPKPVVSFFLLHLLSSSPGLYIYWLVFKYIYSRTFYEQLLFISSQPPKWPFIIIQMNLRWSATCLERSFFLFHKSGSGMQIHILRRQELAFVRATVNQHVTSPVGEWFQWVLQIMCGYYSLEQTHMVVVSLHCFEDTRVHQIA